MHSDKTGISEKTGFTPGCFQKRKKNGKQAEK